MARWLVGAALIALGVALLWVLPVLAPSEIRARGVESRGQVQMKDSVPGAGGDLTYTVTFIFPDTMGRNHMVTRPVYDVGLWERLEVGSEVKVRYLPEDPEAASFQGAEGMGPRRGRAASFAGWSALIAGAAVCWLAFRAAEAKARAKAPPPGRGPIVSRR
ncbi:MAG TPA: DUF3592 domain-containing protein [Chthonomonadales bacterium]|nr:DUF3592 domain-containing protein [Chthonomonadales bacterium]